MKKTVKSILFLFLIPSVMVVSSCSTKIVDDLGTKNLKVQEYETPFVFNKYVKQAGIVANETDLDLLLNDTELPDSLSEFYSHSYKKTN